MKMEFNVMSDYMFIGIIMGAVIIAFLYDLYRDLKGFKDDKKDEKE